MNRTGVRRMVSLALALLGFEPVTALAETTPFTVPASAELTQLVVYPPKSSRPSPVVVMLHGMCDVPENECPLFAEATTEQAWLVCPRGDAVCPGGGATWSWGKRKELPERVIRYMTAQYGERIDARRGHTLAGFSLGALAAVDATSLGVTSFRHLLLIGAKVEPSLPLLRRADITDVVMMAGRWDMMYGHMKQRSHALERGGINTRFFDLGEVGHWFPRDFTFTLREALRYYEPEIA